MEGIKTVRHTVRKGDFLAKVDLTDAFLTVPIFRGHSKYLRFRWGRNTFEFTCLPFGLSSSPRVLTKVLKVAVTFLRRSGPRRLARRGRYGRGMQKRCHSGHRHPRVSRLSD